MLFTTILDRVSIGETAEAPERFAEKFVARGRLPIGHFEVQKNSREPTENPVDLLSVA